MRRAEDVLDYKRMALHIRRELSKMDLDLRFLEIEVYHGVVYLRGRLGPMGRRRDWDFKKEVAKIVDMIQRMFPGRISQVVTTDLQPLPT